VAQVARDLDLPSNLLRRWKQELVCDPADSFQQGTAEAHEEELARLTREPARATQERDFLKSGRRTLRRRRDEMPGDSGACGLLSRHVDVPGR
jgi:transposase-like protein